VKPTRKNIAAVIVLVIAVLGAVAISGASGSSNTVRSVDLGKAPVCHRIGGSEETLVLPIRAAVNHLIPSLTDPTTDHRDYLGFCGDPIGTPLPPPDQDLSKYKFQVCHRVGGAQGIQLELSLRGALEHLLPHIIDPTGNYADVLGSCIRPYTTPPPMTPPPDSP
jgi:hypothetical protein